MKDHQQSVSLSSASSKWASQKHCSCCVQLAQGAIGRGKFWVPLHCWQARDVHEEMTIKKERPSKVKHWLHMLRSTPGLCWKTALITSFIIPSGPGTFLLFRQGNSHFRFFREEADFIDISQIKSALLWTKGEESKQYSVHGVRWL